MKHNPKAIKKANNKICKGKKLESMKLVTKSMLFLLSLSSIIPERE